MVHYRRYFLSEPITKGMIELPLINEQKARDILKDYDIILRFKLFERSDSIKRNWISLFGIDVSKKTYDIIRKWMLIRQPDYIPHLDFILGNTGFFTCNMFITKKKIIDSYCEWLFSFLLDAVKEWEISDFKDQCLRIMGYWGELLFTVWIIKQNLRIKQLPWWMAPESVDNK